MTENENPRNLSPEQEAARVEAERIARAFHAAYESLAPEFDYETRPESRVQLWADVPEKNRALMIGTVERLIATGVLRAPAPTQGQSIALERADELADRIERVYPNSRFTEDYRLARAHTEGEAG